MVASFLALALLKIRSCFSSFENKVLILALLRMELIKAAHVRPGDAGAPPEV